MVKKLLKKFFQKTHYVDWNIFLDKMQEHDEERLKGKAY